MRNFISVFDETCARLFYACAAGANKTWLPNLIDLHEFTLILMIIILLQLTLSK